MSLDSFRDLLNAPKISSGITFRVTRKEEFDATHTLISLKTGWIIYFYLIPKAYRKRDVLAFFINGWIRKDLDIAKRENCIMRGSVSYIDEEDDRKSIYVNNWMDYHYFADTEGLILEIIRDNIITDLSTYKLGKNLLANAPLTDDFRLTDDESRRLKNMSIGDDRPIFHIVKGIKSEEMKGAGNPPDLFSCNDRVTINDVKQLPEHYTLISFYVNLDEYHFLFPKGMVKANVIGFFGTGYIFKENFGSEYPILFLYKKNEYSIFVHAEQIHISVNDWENTLYFAMKELKTNQLVRLNENVQLPWIFPEIANFLNMPYEYNRAHPEIYGEEIYGEDIWEKYEPTPYATNLKNAHPNDRRTLFEMFNEEDKRYEEHRKLYGAGKKKNNWYNTKHNLEEFNIDMNMNPPVMSRIYVLLEIETESSSTFYAIPGNYTKFELIDFLKSGTLKKFDNVIRGMYSCIWFGISEHDRRPIGTQANVYINDWGRFVSALGEYPHMYEINSDINHITANWLTGEALRKSTELNPEDIMLSPDAYRLKQIMDYSQKTIIEILN